MPWRLKNALSITWTYAARATKPKKPAAMTATMNWLRQMGVLLANNGLEVYCTLRLLMGEPPLGWSQSLRPQWHIA